MNRKRGNFMIENTKEWLNAILASSGESEVTRDVIVGTIEIIERSIVECGDPEDVISLDELNDMLCEFD